MAVSATLEIRDKALKRKDELLLELEALENIIETCDNLISMTGGETAEEDEEPHLFKLPSARETHAEQIAKMIDAARKIIISERRPMQRGELRERVEAVVKLKIAGKDKNKVFGTNLWRSKKFDMVKGHGYWPKGETLPDEFA